MKKLLALLQDGRFHSGQELGIALGVSRSAVWKYLQRIESELGVGLFKVPGRGYRLSEPLSLLEYEDISSALAPFGWGLYLSEKIDSTNAEAMRLHQSGVTEPFVVMAESQTGGRGRRGRIWVSPAAQNIYFTLALKITSGPQRLSGLSLVVGLAVMQALRQAGVAGVGLKWPNDIYVQGKKIAGILLELSGDPADECHVFIGIGVNVNMMSSTIEIGQSWTSVRAEVGRLVDRNALTRGVGESLHKYLTKHFISGFSVFRSEWDANNIWHGKNCTLTTGSQQISGVVLGVDEQGALRLLVGGHERLFNGGELSLRLKHDS